MYSFTARDLFKESVYEVENTAEQHYRLLNTLKLIDHDGYLYCFCKKFLVHRKSLEVHFVEYLFF